MRRLLVLFVCVGLGSCTRGDPPAGSVAPPEPASTASGQTVASTTASPAPAASIAPPVIPVPTAEAGPPDMALPALLDDAGAPLPQTEARPSATSAWFLTRGEKLFQSIAKDDPESSLHFFFPLVAYRAVKDVADPSRDYKFRLIANFKRDVHDYHKRLGPRASEARFVGIDVPEAEARWMKPHTEGNRVGYYRVLGSRLRYENADGKRESLEVTSFISWRGEWYLVHLHGFK